MNAPAHIGALPNAAAKIALMRRMAENIRLACARGDVMSAAQRLQSLQAAELMTEISLDLAAMDAPRARHENNPRLRT